MALGARDTAPDSETDLERTGRDSESTLMNIEEISSDIRIRL